MNVLLQILELGIREILPIEELVARLKNIFTLNPDVKISIQNLAAEAIQADDDTIQMVADWQTAHGLPVTVKPPAPVPQILAPGPTLVNAAAATAGPGDIGAVGETGSHGELGTNKPA